MQKYIFVTGGVISGLGKGITAASLGCLLKARGYRVSMQKLDPYLNVDPGTMSPYQHGEVFVTNDGAETDLDIGHYERFIDENLTKHSSITAGKVYSKVIEEGRERNEVVQVIPHVTTEICKSITDGAGDSEIAIIEVGGTVGDIESMPFIEAIRQFSLQAGKNSSVFVHLALLPYLDTSKEFKTKPIQHSVRTLLKTGIETDILVCRTISPISDEVRKKLAIFCNVDADSIICNTDVSTLYEAPIMLENEGLTRAVLKKLKLEDKKPDMVDWEKRVNNIKSAKKTVTVALVGKYVQLHDSYLSVVEALKHSAAANNVQLDIKWIDAELINDNNTQNYFGKVDGIILPGGFGDRGVEGMISTCAYARKNNLPYFGICLGMQVAAIEFARNELGLTEANSTEFNAKTPDPVIYLMPDKHGKDIGGTLRLGIYGCVLDKNSKCKEIYNSEYIEERHRHRYEFNNVYIERFLEKGMLIAGKSPDGVIVEMLEYPQNRWHIGGQFHPEFLSRFNKPHALFISFVKEMSK